MKATELEYALAKNVSTMSSAKQLGHAIKIASIVFANKVGKDKQPYMLHCIQVMHDVDPHGLNHELSITAILHDVVEDSSVTIMDLQNMGYSVYVLQSIVYLSHTNKNMSYIDYIKLLMYDEFARKVKLADLRHNLSLYRLSTTGDMKLNRIGDYMGAYELLMSIERLAKENEEKLNADYPESKN